MLASLVRIKSLEDCTDQELEALADICQTVKVRAGDRIFEAGDQADFLYFVSRGLVELRVKVSHYLATSEITIDRVREGETFGWSALTKSKSYTLSALAVSDGELLKAPAADVRRMCASNHDFGYVLMKNISVLIGERYELTRKMLVNVIQKELDEKERRM